MIVIDIPLRNCRNARDEPITCRCVQVRTQSGETEDGDPTNSETVRHATRIAKTKRSDEIFCLTRIARIERQGRGKIPGQRFFQSVIFY